MTTDQGYPELNGRQRLELSLLEHDADRSAPGPPYSAALVAIARYLVAERVGPDHFVPRGDRLDMPRCYMVSVVLASGPERHPPGSLGYDLRAAAGVG